MIKKTVGKVLNGLEVANRKDNKLTLNNLKFLMNAYDKLTVKEIKVFSETVQAFFHLKLP